MSQLQSGLETLSGIGGTQANSLFDANLQRLDAFARELLAFHFLGAAQTNQVFFKVVLPWDVYVEKIIFNAHFGPPTGAALLAKVKVNGVDATKNFTLADSAMYGADTPTNPTDILVTAGQTIELYFSQIGATNPGTDINGWLQLAKRNL